MPDVLALSFDANGPRASSSWSISVTPKKLPTTAIANPPAADGFPQPLDHGWRPAPKKKLRIDTAKVPATFGEFSVEIWLADADVKQPLTLLAGLGSPVAIRLEPGSGGGSFTASAAITTTGDPIALRWSGLSTAKDTVVRLGVWVSGTDAVLAVDGMVTARLRLPRVVPDPKGDVVVGLADTAEQGSITVLGLWVRDLLDAAQRPAMTDAAASGLGEIDSVLAAGGYDYLGAPTGDEHVLGGIRWRTFQNGEIYWSAGTGAQAVNGRILEKYHDRGGALGRLGLPVGPDLPLDDLLDWMNAPKLRGTGLLLGDIVKKAGKLKESDLVVDLPGTLKAARPQRKLGGWDVFAPVARELGSTVIPLAASAATRFAQALNDHADVDVIPRLKQHRDEQQFGIDHVVLLAHGEQRGPAGGRRRVGLRGQVTFRFPGQLTTEATHVTLDKIAANRVLSSLGHGVAAGALSAGQLATVAPQIALRHEGATAFIKGSALDAPFPARPDAGAKALLTLADESARFKTEFKLVDPDGQVWHVVGPRAQLFQYGLIVSTVAGCYDLYGEIVDHWARLGGSRGFLGAPRNDELDVPGVPTGRVATFAGGRIYRSDRTGAHEVHGAILPKYFEGGIANDRGMPTSDELDVPGSPRAKMSRFENGIVFWTPERGAISLFGALCTGWRNGGGLNRYGMPTAAPVTVGFNPRVTYQDFERGVIAVTDTGETFDSLQLRIASVRSGGIDDTGPAPADWDDHTAELIARATVWVDGRQEFTGDTGAGGAAQNPGWQAFGMPLRLMPGMSIRLRIEAWDHDVGPDDHLADHDVTFSAANNFFGYGVKGGSHFDARSTWHAGGDDPGDAIRYDYTLAPEEPIDIRQMRQKHFWSFQNKGSDRLSWDMYRQTFKDVTGSEVNYLLYPFQSWYYETFYRDIANGGNCFGFSVTALDAFYRRSGFAQEIHRFGEEPDLWKLLNEGQGEQRAASVQMYKSVMTIAANTVDPRRVYQRIKARTDAGEPVILSLRSDGAGHAVLIYRCEQAGDNRVMFLADSNQPDPQYSDAQSVLIIAPDGSYLLSPASGIAVYLKYAGPPWVDGVVPQCHMVDIPYGIVADPLYTPIDNFATMAAWGFAALLSADNADISQVSAGGKKLIGDQRRTLLDRLTVESAALKAASRAGLVASARAGGDAHFSTEMRSRVFDAVQLLGGSAIGSFDTKTVSKASVAALPGGVKAAAAWGDITLVSSEEVHSIQRGLNGPAIGAVLTPGAWPTATFLDADEDRPDGPRLVGLRGTIDPEIVTELRGRGGEYRYSMVSKGGIITVTAQLPPGKLDLITSVRLGTPRPEVRIATTAVGRIASVDLRLTTRGASAVGWIVPLGLGEADATVSWLPGRPGLAITNAIPVPSTLLRWTSAKGGAAYAAPTLAAGETLRLLPNDPASPLGAMRVQRLAVMGDLLESLLVDPSA